MKPILIFGATGFVGMNLCKAAATRGHEVHVVCRREDQMDSFSKAVHCHLFDQLADKQSLPLNLPPSTVVFHLADSAQRNAADLDGSAAITREVAGIAIRANLKRIVYSSSIYASIHMSGQSNSYGAGKLNSEKLLRDQPEISSVILRLPPVYGLGSVGGVTFLASLISRGLPIPFGLANSLRDYLHIDNLIDLLLSLADLKEEEWKQLARAEFPVSDGVPIGTASLVRHIASQLGKPARLFSVPKSILRPISSLVGKSEQVGAAFNALRAANDRKIISVCQWEPKKTMPETLSYLNRSFK